MTAPTLPDDLTDALVAAVDDSPSARGALRWAASLAGALGRPLHVVSVWNFVNGHAPADQGQDRSPSVEGWQSEAERRLGVLLEQEVAGADVRPVVLHGNTTPALLAVSQQAGHLVVGSRGRGGVAGLLLGSTSEELVRHAGCPVTVVRHGGTPGA